MKILWVNACVRGEESRTLRLARYFLEGLRRAVPDARIITHDLTEMALAPVDAAMLAEKEALCDAQSWEHPMLRPALELAQADVVVIAAPYWDLSFPSVLKIWVENVYARKLTFVYRNETPVGLCKGKEAVYITTAGSPIGRHDWGAAYMRDVMRTLGIPGWTRISAEGLDLDGADAEELLARAEEEIRNSLLRFQAGKP